MLISTNVELIVHPNQELLLTPGDAIMVLAPAGAPLFVNLFWRERFIEESEKSGNYGKIL